MTALQAFTNHEFGTIRTITSGGQVLFCGRDVANALGYQDPANAVKLHRKGGGKLPPPCNAWWRPAGQVQKQFDVLSSWVTRRKRVPQIRRG